MNLKLFPPTNYTNLKYDTEGLYSLTNFNDADYISILLLENFTNYINLKILDGTGGLGGNTISFSKFFKNVTSIELNHDRFLMLKNNIEHYNLSNINLLNNDSVDYLFNNYTNYNIYFFDPPWGGPNYKYEQNISLNLGSKSLIDIILFLKQNTKEKIIVYKLPFNYDFNEFHQYNYKLYKVKNYFIIIIFI